MKKLSVVLSLLTAAMLALVLAGCAAATPSEVTTKALNAVKSGTPSALAEFFLADSEVASTSSLGDVLTDSGSMSLDEEQTAESQAAIDVFKKQALDFDFTVGNESINGDTATVDVEFKVHDLGTCFTEAFGEFFSESLKAAFAEAFGGPKADADALTAKFYTDFADKMNATDKSTTVNATITLKKADGKWKIDGLSDEAKDALTGSFYTGVKELADWSSKMSAE